MMRDYGNKYGYARVSSRNQNLDRQILSLRRAGIDEKSIFIDRQSGKTFNRPGYKRMVRKLKARDELYIKSIDRLGRNYDEILEQWRFLTKVKKIDVVVLDFPLLNTRTPVNGITGEFISDLVLQILSYVAQVERENTHQRQMEGIKAAKKRGVRFGRPRIPIPYNFEEVADEIRRKKISLREGASRLGISHTTLRKWMKNEKVEKNVDNYSHRKFTAR